MKQIFSYPLLAPQLSGHWGAMLLSLYSLLSRLNIRVIHEWSLTAAVSASGSQGSEVNVPLSGPLAGPLTLAN